MPPVLITALTAGLAALIPKALTDAYDYFFNDEEIHVRKKADKTELNRNCYTLAHQTYQEYLEGHIKTQRELTDKLNRAFMTNKSISQMMRICRSNQ